MGPHGRRSRRDERGGAVSLWVVLMVPVSAFAALVAMAGPQRVAAESSVQDAAEDLAMLAVAWRDGQGANAVVGAPQGPLYAFPPECDNDGQPTPFDTSIETAQVQIGGYQARIVNWTPRDPLTVPQLETERDLEQDRHDQLVDRRDERRGDWKAACELVRESVLRDLGYLGVNAGSLQGFYSDSLTISPVTNKPPCRASPGTMVEDAVHVALAADWQHAGWAAAQVWPEGTRVAAESIGRLSLPDTANPAIGCGESLAVLDERGRSRLGPSDPSRELTRSVPRTLIPG
ncbi:hypothetical protein [Candidatus Poriferisodalis sp.]|uniref:hypothetical protein n=1 Tax=Candidatus Poriferisodalis sp. TaxID=3101277 RepID=UPI003C6FBBD4